MIIDDKDLKDSSNKEFDLDQNDDLFELESDEDKLFFEEDTEPSKLVAKSKHLRAVEMVEQAKKIVDQIDNQMQDCRLLLADDLREYEEAKRLLHDVSLDKGEDLLNDIGKVDDERSIDDDYVVFEPEEEIEPMIVKNVSSGKFTGILLALMAGVVTLLGLVFLATEKLGITLRLDQAPSSEMINSIFSWFGIPFTGREDFSIGSTVVVLILVLVMAIVYWVRVSMKGNTNLNFAFGQLEEAKVYAERKGDCKSEMEKVDSHINECIKTFDIYRVLLNEQNGKLVRILYIEGNKSSEELHHKSIIEIADTQKLIDAIYTLMETPMSEKGKLSSKSEYVLNRTKEKAENLISRLY